MIEGDDSRGPLSANAYGGTFPQEAEPSKADPSEADLQPLMRASRRSLTFCSTVPFIALSRKGRSMAT